MRSPLIKRLRRDLKTHWGRYAAIFIIFVVMVTIISTFLVTARGVRITYDNDHINNKVEDGLFSSYTEIGAQVIDAVQDLGISIYENHYVEETTDSGSTLRIYQKRQLVNVQTFWEGEQPVAADEIAVDRLLAENHNLVTGDLMKIAGQDYKITGLVSLPDYSSLFVSNTDLMMDSYGFGVAVTSEQGFEALPEANRIYNYAYRYQERNLSERERIDLSDEIKEMLVAQGVPLTAFLMAEDNQAISFLADDMGSDVPMMKVFLYIILIIMAFVFTVVITSSVEEDASVTGTLMASGYRRGELLRYYLALPVLVTLIGAVVGNILSYTAGLPMFQRIYYSAYSIPPMEVHFNPEALILTTILPIVLISIINVTVLLRVLSLSPLKFLRRDLKRTKNKRAVRLPDISFMGRFRLRVILQNMGSYVILFFGMLFASFILLFGLCMKPVIERYIDSIEEAVVSEYQYILKIPFEIEEDTRSEKFALQRLEVHYSAGDKELETTFYGIPERSDYWDINVSEMGENTVIVSEELRKKMGVNIGDTLTFTDLYSGDSYDLKVTATKSYPVGFTAFMPLEQLNDMLGREEQAFNGYLADEELDFPAEVVATVITPEDMAGLGEQVMSTFGEMAGICLGAAVVIYLVLMYILTKVILDKNAQNISFMKVMGYQDREIRKLYLTATIIAVAVSLVVSLPLINWGLGGAFHLAFIEMNGYLEPQLPMYLFGLVAGIGFTAYLIINMIHMRRIQRIDMAEVLKNRE